MISSASAAASFGVLPPSAMIRSNSALIAVSILAFAASAASTFAASAAFSGTGGGVGTASSAVAVDPVAYSIAVAGANE